jgi:hypothetical protein
VDNVCHYRLHRGPWLHSQMYALNCGYRSAGVGRAEGCMFSRDSVVLTNLVGYQCALHRAGLRCEPLSSFLVRILAVSRHRLSSVREVPG